MSGLAFGEGTIFHFMPFQCRVSVFDGFWPLRPTAQMSCAFTASMPKSRLSFDVSPAFGLVTCFHLVPFQCRISVRYADASRNQPTAHALSERTCATAQSSLAVAPGLVLVICAQDDPTRRRMRVCSARADHSPDGPRRRDVFQGAGG